VKPDPSLGQPLKGRRILIVEDQFLIAEDMRLLVVRLGGEVVGPAADLAGSRALAQDRAVDFALLDINLDGEDVYGLAAELRERGVPVIFATGYEAPTMPKEFQDTPQILKPVVAIALAAAVEQLLLSPAGKSGS
jgi:DNA-binding LytR/AlgR family response regulator